jgi:hypothetical protein
MILRNSSFLDNVNPNGCLLMLLDFDGSHVVIDSNRFFNNSVVYGTALVVGHWTDKTSLNFISNINVENIAQQGGAIFWYGYSLDWVILNNNFVNNEAELYGNSFASPPFQAIWIQPFRHTIMDSGGRFPSFSLTCVDLFLNVPQARGFNIDFFVATIKTFGSLKSQANGSIIKQDQKPLLNGHNLINFTETEFVGHPGNYTLRIEPAINFKSELLTLESTFAVRQCAEQNMLIKLQGEMYPRCVPGDHLLLYIQAFF